MEYNDPAKFVLDGVRFSYRGEIYKGKGFLEWDPKTGFRIDALLDKNFAPVDAFKTLGQIIVNTKEDTFTIWLDVRGHGRAFVPRAFPLGQKHSFQPDISDASAKRQAPELLVSLAGYGGRILSDGNLFNDES